MSGEKQQIPLYKKQLIIEIIKRNPRMPYKEIARKLNTTHSYVAKTISEAKRDGLLEKRRYGALGGRKPLTFVEDTEKIDQIVEDIIKKEEETQ